MTHKKSFPFQAYLGQPEHQAFFFFTLASGFALTLLSKIDSFSLIPTLLIEILIIIITRKIASGRGYQTEYNKHVQKQALSGKTALVIGCAGGIGHLTAQKIAALDPDNLILAVRGRERAERLAKEISILSLKTDVVGYDLDISSLESIKEFVSLIKAKYTSIDLLIDNAGMLQSPYAKEYKLTPEGLEPTFATNCIGPFYLVELLLPLLLKEKGTRVLIVGSIAHYYFAQKGIDYSLITRSEAQVKNNPSEYHNAVLYGQSKLGNIFHLRDLNQKYEKDYGLTAYCVHPGTIDTGLNRNFPWLFRRGFSSLLKLIGKTMEDGVQTTLFCALSNDAVPGEFHQDCGVGFAADVSFDQRKIDEFCKNMRDIIQEKIKS